MDTHPGRVILESQQTRRTRRQIEANEASAEAEASAARQAVETQRHASIVHIADIEDLVMQEEECIQAHANRPDLRPQPGRQAHANAKGKKKGSNPG